MLKNDNLKNDGLVFSLQNASLAIPYNENSVTSVFFFSKKIKIMKKMCIF